MLDELKELEATGRAELETVTDADALERWRIRYLASKGRLKALMPALKTVPAKRKPVVGKRLNEVKASLERAFAQKKAAL
ncbi:MAG: hypothetical protein V3T24_02810, partial [Longimicrobiales bacterium]